MLKELCEKAQINKSTFYVYYHDVYDLSDKIENEVISEVVKKLDNTEEILTDPAGFAEKLFLGYSAQDSLISTIFAGTRAGQLPLKIEASLQFRNNLNSVLACTLYIDLKFRRVFYSFLLQIYAHP